MGITYYPLYILIQEPYENMFEDVLKRLHARFKNIAGTKIELTESHRIEISRDDWTYNLVWEREADYLEEFKDMAKVILKDKPDQLQVCLNITSYIEGWSTPDPNMDYFNDYVYIQEEFDKIPDIYIFVNHNMPGIENEFRPSDASK